MEEGLANLICTIDSRAQKDTKELIRTKIYKWMDELRKNDEYSRILEREEINFWNILLSKNRKKNDIRKLVNIYECLNSLSYTNDILKDLVNKE